MKAVFSCRTLHFRFLHCASSSSSVAHNHFLQSLCSSREPVFFMERDSISTEGEARGLQLFTIPTKISLRDCQRTSSHLELRCPTELVIPESRPGIAALGHHADGENGRTRVVGIESKCRSDGTSVISGMCMGYGHDKFHLLDKPLMTSTLRGRGLQNCQILRTKVTDRFRSMRTG